ncbi:hypothetical protein [Sulfitobacter sp. JB4-11]|uniref:hypothetical protein n=1 Tax=Sulfitobacter rhodophyticola TaxID=3238304 RepID=UPI003D81ACE2
MFEKMQKIELSRDELEIIEAALHTQSQILNVEAGAGATTARERLNGVKRVLTMLDQQRPVDEAAKPRTTGGWFGMSRILG